MRRGFTLVELSIVLVIIGLLIGGILVAQSMVSTTKTQRVVRELQQYDIAVVNFKITNKSLPGDTPYLSPPGNNNGDLGTGTDGSTCLGNDTTITDYPEAANFFVHLSQAGFKPDNQTYAAGVTPRLSYSKDAEVLPVGGQGEACPLLLNPGGNANYFVIRNGNTSLFDNFLYTDAPIFEPAAASSIDQKMDDGKPLNGNLRGTNDDGSSAGIYCVETAGDAMTNYDTSRITAQCELALRMLSQTEGQ